VLAVVRTFQMTTIPTRWVRLRRGGVLEPIDSGRSRTGLRLTATEASECLEQLEGLAKRVMAVRMLI
jgi:hypothetical protein